MNPVLDFYNKLSANYDQEQEEFAFVRLPEKKRIFQTLELILQQHQTVLEIGAGTGRFTLPIAQKTSQVFALDLSQDMLAQLKLKMTQAQIHNIETFCGDFLSFPEHTLFDVLVSFSAIEYIKDSEALFKKISALVKPGGKVIITTAHNTFVRFWGRLGNYFRQGIFMQAYSKRKMKRLLEKNGFELMEMEDLALKTFFTKGILLFVHAQKKAGGA